MERNVPSINDILKRKAVTASDSPKDKRARNSSTLAEGAKEKVGSLPEPRPSKAKNNEVAKNNEAATEASKNTDTALVRPPRSGPNEGPNKGVVVWQPKLARVSQGTSRPVLSNDTVEDPFVALGLSDVFLLPKDKGKNQDKSLSQLREQSLSYVGLVVNGVAELHRRCLNYEDLLRDASKREGMVKTELSRQTEKLKASQKHGKEMEERLEKGSRLLKEANEATEKAKAEGRVLSRANSELKKQIEEFPAKLVAEYNAGAEKATDNAAIEIPELLEEQWVDGFTRAWAYALQMAKIEPSSDLFNRCNEAMDLTRSKIIGEQASAGLEISSVPASPVVNPVATEILFPQVKVTGTVLSELPSGSVTCNVEDMATGAKEKTDQPKTGVPSKDLPA